MASTNKTAHYDLSQYVASDKPTYLVDYNSDMSNIDTGIATAQTKADTAYTSADTAIANAANAQTTADTAVTNAAAAQTTANLASSNIGTMTNLETSAKTDLVSAINEVNTKASTSEVVDSMSGTQTDKAPSVNSVISYLQGTTLFEGTYQTGSITLPQAASNFEYIEISYKDSNSRLYTTKVKFIDNGQIELTGFQTTTGAARIFERVVTISGTSLTTNSCGYVFLNSQTRTDASDSIIITKIVGFNY